MRNHILDVLKTIEKDYNIKILFACESGSRAWGVPSKDSDYDVRFIYVHQKDWYLSIDQKRDVIEVPKHDPISIPVDELLDVSGWELAKALRLFRKSNPPLVEWLRSGIVYYQSGKAIDTLRELSGSIYSPVSGIHHYLNMAKGNYREYLQSPSVKIKKYFYVLRPILAAKWIKKYNTIPAMEFKELVEDIIPNGVLKEEVMVLLKRKIAGDELDLELRIEAINQFIEGEISRLEAYAKTLNVQIEDPTEQLNRLFRDTLEEAWR
ncbi:nucleotidyltransferase domain-containing protein [Neobacillus piezotolerans]|uniref:Nucleotidyltransferase domain-containing protein n=1 Tax=Neobacillus piezotolerans TaxID=2259171 RepID=A0A3D8GU05_9BACI|nr:nucleotidyltransferase domain-containing protein [Neobacillus piezotolerans]RDU37526.1 nucleotidyltransferase domain-containing protein [Neobacillus piezotolerans]